MSTLTLHDISKSYGSNRILDGISLEVAEGNSSLSLALPAVGKAHYCAFWPGWTMQMKAASPLLGATLPQRIQPTEIWRWSFNLTRSIRT